MKSVKKLKSIPSGLKDRYSQLSTVKYSQIAAESVQVNAKKTEIKIGLPVSVIKDIQDVKFYDSKGTLGEINSFKSYKIVKNAVIINLGKMPVAGKLTVLIVTDKRILTVKYKGKASNFGQWRLTSGVRNNLIVTPWSNGVIRPYRRQIVIKNFTLVDKKLVVETPVLKVDDVLVTSSNNQEGLPVNYEATRGRLVIDINDFAAVQGEAYTINVMSNDIKYRLFDPYSMLLDKDSRYHKISEPTNYVYVSGDGYLSFLWENDKFEADNIDNIDGTLQISFIETPQITELDRIVARRYHDMVIFDHEINGNVVMLTPINTDFPMATGFSYRLEVEHHTDKGMVRTPVILKETAIDELGEEYTATSKIDLTGFPLEVIGWEAVQVMGELDNDVVTINAVEPDVIVETVFAKYKERPVYTDITNGITVNKLQTSYSELRIVYRKDEKLFAGSERVATIIDNLFE